MSWGSRSKQIAKFEGKLCQSVSALVDAIEEIKHPSLHHLLYDFREYGDQVVKTMKAHVDKTRKGGSNEK